MKRSTASALAATLALSAIGLVVAPAANADNIGNEGCTPGYWKNHTESWEEYRPDTTVGQVFAVPAPLAAYGEVTLLEALSLKGGKGVDGATEILLRAATASTLNAAHEGLGFPLRRDVEPGNLRAAVDAALASLDREQMLTLAAELDALNNLGCPLGSPKAGPGAPETPDVPDAPTDAPDVPTDPGEPGDPTELPLPDDVLVS